MQFRHIFFQFFRNCRAFGECAPPLPCTAGARARHSRFRGNLGSIFFRSKIVFFSNFDFDKKWFGGGLDPLAVEKIYFADFFSPLRAPAMGLATRSLRTLEPEHGEVTTRANGQFFYDFGSILAPFGLLVGPFGPFGGLFVTLLTPYCNIRRHI